MPAGVADLGRGSSQGIQGLKWTAGVVSMAQGYGFIVPKDGSEDIFVHQTQIRRSGFRFLAVSQGYYGYLSWPVAEQ